MAVLLYPLLDSLLIRIWDILLQMKFEFNKIQLLNIDSLPLVNLNQLDQLLAVVDNAQNRILDAVVFEMEELKSPVLLIGVLVMWPMLFDLIYKVIHLFHWEPIGLPQTVLFLYLVVMVVFALLVEFRLIQNISNKRNVFRVYLALFANKNLLYLFHPKFLEVIVFVDYFFQLFK